MSAPLQAALSPLALPDSGNLAPTAPDFAEGPTFEQVQRTTDWFVAIQPASVFIVGLGAALAGATLGCLPGMALGGMVGYYRRRDLARAADAAPESDNLFFKAVMFPLLGGVVLWTLYLVVFTPWALEFLEKNR